MSLQNVKAGGAFVEITARDKTAAGLKSAMGKAKAFAAGMQSIGASLAGVGAAVSGLGAAIITPLAGAAKLFSEVGSAISDMSARTGVATDHLSELVYAAEQGGASAADLETALKMMAKNGLDPNKFDETAAAIAAISDPAERVAAALKLWGKGGTKLLPILDSLAALRGEARSLGLTISPEAAERADALGDAMDRLMKVAKDLAFEVGNAIAEPLIRFADVASQLAASLASWVQQNQAVIVTIGAIGVIALTAGAAITAMGVTILAASIAVSGIAAGLTAIATGAGIAVAAIALLVGGIAAAAAGWLLFTESGKYASESFLEMIGGIANAIASGNLLNAWGQLGTGMVMVWMEVVKKIKQAFFQVMQEVTAIMAMTLDSLGNQIMQLPFGEDLGKTLKGLAIFGKVVTDYAASTSLGKTDATISVLQAQLDALRAAVAPEVKTVQAATIRVAKMATEGVVEKNLGGAAGTFNASAASLLGRAGGPMDRTAKNSDKQVSLLEKIREALNDIDGSIEDLEGFSFQ